MYKIYIYIRRRHAHAVLVDARGWRSRGGGRCGGDHGTRRCRRVCVRACVLCCAGQRERVKVERRRSMQEVGGGAMVVSSSLSSPCVHAVVVDARGWRLMREGGSRLERRWSLHSSMTQNLHIYLSRPRRRAATLTTPRRAHLTALTLHMFITPLNFPRCLFFPPRFSSLPH